MRFAMEEISDEVDWNGLHRAKQLLIQRIWHEPDSELWKLVELVNNIQQAGIDAGKWSFPERSEVVRKSDVTKMEVQDGDLCWDSARAVGMEWRGGKWVDVPYTHWAARHSERS